MRRITSRMLPSASTLAAPRAMPYGHAQTVQCIGSPVLGGVCHEFTPVSTTTSCVYEANETHMCVVL